MRKVKTKSYFVNHRITSLGTRTTRNFPSLVHSRLRYPRWRWTLQMHRLTSESHTERVCAPEARRRALPPVVPSAAHLSLSRGGRRVVPSRAYCFSECITLSCIHPFHIRQFKSFRWLPSRISAPPCLRTRLPTSTPAFLELSLLWRNHLSP